jgi:hypothetical protein
MSSPPAGKQRPYRRADAPFSVELPAHEDDTRQAEDTGSGEQNP